jgi:hypothetical protein
MLDKAGGETVRAGTICRRKLGLAHHGALPTTKYAVVERW